jgi:hypothetical protein
MQAVWKAWSTVGWNLCFLIGGNSDAERFGKVEWWKLITYSRNSLRRRARDIIKLRTDNGLL